MDKQVENVEWEGSLLATIIRAEALPKETTFLTPAENNLQVGFVVYPTGGEVARHVHKPIERRIVGTAEVILIKQGCCDIDLYNPARELVATRELRAGDLLFLVGGGHGFRMKQDTVLMEIKQGPYTGLEEKERF